ncbi:Pyrophosphate--fructose 6-phosphate 1-phosphotransferase [Caulifigura coniformis]|uniref:Pyrophosphate--fructose 6-phosphate 1-phosphotransferase n=1 Tax=Caulifigura coniformis TaxID=2527983 RepID=A0A517SI03_9PLAN|nr:6-phosphofructokinase [Caulifigura coniformis]QDT55754.1 Pyrophosphate--fructose 6-phosphate 1-phosphotransferase [Caulifigura coniformis]
MSRANALVGQSGGPTSVINASLAGVVDGALRSRKIEHIYGMRYGIEGVLNDALVDLGRESSETLKLLRKTPSSALGSSRLKLKDEHFEPILAQFRKYDIRYLFLIGGNDTMDTIHRITEYAHSVGWDMTGVGVPKTVDNDLFGTDHTPGFPSAARYVAMSVLQAGLLARDMQKVDQFVIFQCIGRSAGWLPAATTAAREQSGDAPHILLFPERPFDKERFLGKVREVHEEHGFVSIVCGEGITYADGSPVSASETKDKFGNVEFGAMGGTSVAVTLHQMISKAFGWRGEFQITESLPMCAADRGVKLDFREAYRAGRQAVKLASKGTGDVMVTLQRKPGRSYHPTFGTIPLKEVAVHARPMPDEFISEDGYDVTPAFTEYLEPLIGELPEYARLKYKPAKKAEAEE